MEFICDKGEEIYIQLSDFLFFSFSTILYVVIMHKKVQLIIEINSIFEQLNVENLNHCNSIFCIVRFSTVLFKIFLWLYMISVC